MKANAIVRIVLYSLVLVLLLGIMAAGLGKGQFIFSFGSNSGETVHGVASVPAADVSALRIDWASGNITLRVADTDKITFEESGQFDQSKAMVYSVKNGVLRLSYGKANVQIGFVSNPSKDLTVTVPKDWICKDLELDGASLTVNMEGVSIGNLDIDGAACEISLRGAVETLECDGASCEIVLVCTNRPREMDLDGAACKLDLTLPAGCGFEAEMEGLDCDFSSPLAYTSRDGEYRCGDGYCKISADGISCKVTVREGN